MPISRARSTNTTRSDGHLDTLAPVVYLRAMTDALVIFEDDTAHPLGHILKPGYRHVWCAVIDERAAAWVTHDVRIDQYITTLYSAADYPLAEHLQAEGRTVLGIERKKQRTLGPTVLNNCVGLTKVICGIRSTARSPWQLYQYLMKQEGTVEWPALLTT